MLIVNCIGMSFCSDSPQMLTMRHYLKLVFDLPKNSTPIASYLLPTYISLTCTIVQVDQWERTLSRILEVIELILTVQRQWMYLENIFLGEDIRKQVIRSSDV